MLWVPAASAFVLHAAVRVFPDPVSATPAQPAMLVPPSLKFTDPDGALPVMAAVKVMLVPTIDGLAELATLVVDAGVLTICDSAELLEGAFEASPE
jgi:hypothetical protein